MITMEQRNIKYPLMGYWILLLVLLMGMYSSLTVNEKLNEFGKPWISATIIYVWLLLISPVCYIIYKKLRDTEYLAKSGCNVGFYMAIAASIPPCGWMICFLICSTPPIAALVMIVPTVTVLCIINRIKSYRDIRSVNIKHMGYSQHTEVDSRT
jgi:4-hydroxybenzoate polyprenyltransferase